ncbi:hypothetical protein DL765_004325 [Monosporascus sp. GIB2]|nr:hypothetical protein DL765_004325 [Monosporascus sp. GIB2]
MRLPHHPAGCSDAIYGKAKDASARTGIRADLLIPGRGEPTKNGAVVTHDGRIKFRDSGGHKTMLSGAGVLTGAVTVADLRRTLGWVYEYQGALRASSGGVPSLNDDPDGRQFSDSELKAIVDGVSRSERADVAHAIDKAGILAALRPGARSIEHGCDLDEEATDTTKAMGAILVVTHHIQDGLLSDPHERRRRPSKGSRSWFP